MVLLCRIHVVQIHNPGSIYWVIQIVWTSLNNTMYRICRSYIEKASVSSLNDVD